MREPAVWPAPFHAYMKNKYAAFAKILPISEKLLYNRCVNISNDNSQTIPVRKSNVLRKSNDLC